MLRDTVPALPFRGDSSVLRSDHFKPIVPVPCPVPAPVPVKGDGAEAEGNSSSYSTSNSNSSNSSSDMSSSIREVSASAPSFLPPVSAPKKRRVVGVSDVNGRAISVSIPVSVSAAPAISDGGGDRGGDTNDKGDSSRNSSSSSSSGGVDESVRKRGLRAVRSVTYNGREGEGEGGVQGGEGGAGVAEEVEKEEEVCRPLDSEFHIILMTHAEVRYARTVSYQRVVRTMSHDCDILTAGAIGICVVCCVRVRPSIPGSLPYLTLPYLTLPYLTLPYLTLPYLTLP